MNEDLSPESMREASEQLIRVVTSPEYLELAAEINALPVDERFEATAERLTPEALRTRGLELPEALRISPRWFEPPTAGVLTADDVLAHGANVAAPVAPGGTLCVSVGEIVCVSYGSSAAE
ncbi:hypothetical protein GA0115240_16804 [Streptomyces sp. DvalAA-14]|uniref:hypothetical protein n=1 Tax=unclassified Streptomyces TaxID=2593676 RepID=UPI00081B895F|nr:MULTISPECIES: hypothetical protein [unclassified Streptomyces]MYS24722.1 hypothetical protein [Streptomyces sp. SID4948]SCE48795.1 hypothetical protein GA0115240_16804 [Streptomyces sp. DvalAA-14]